MENFFAFLQIGIPFALLGVGYLAGKRAETQHYRSIRNRERRFLQLPAVTWKTLHDPRPVKSAHLASGSVVVSVDHYKRLLMGLRKIFGGEIRAYSSLLDRGRREALLRLKESAPQSHLILNTRIETSTIFNGQGKATGSVEVLAYGTAIEFGS